MSEELVEELLARCIESDDPRAAAAELTREEPELRGRLNELLDRLAKRGLLASPKLTAVPQVEGYRLLEKLGEGGMGVVYLAEDERLGRRVAIKIVRPELIHFEASRQRLETEVAAIARTSHPGIVQVLGVGESNGQHFFVMDYVAGRPLAAVLDELVGKDPATLVGRDLLVGPDRTASNSRISSIERATWIDACVLCIRDIAEALAHAHQNGVLHRDVKPSNIVLDDTARVRVVDFGLAQLDDGSGLTRSGSVLGSLPYMAPEQVLGERRWIDDRADVYGLGVTMFELLGLRNPFLTDNGETTRRRILAGEHRKLRHLNRKVPVDVERVCYKAMAQEREQRYATMQEFLADLENLREHRPIVARPPGIALRMRRTMQRHPTLSVALLVALLLGIVAATTLAMQQAQANRQAKKLRQQAERVAYRSSITAGTLLLDKALTARAIEQLRSSKEELRAWEWRHLALAADSSIAVLRPHGIGDKPTSVRGVAVCPKEQHLAFVDDTGGLHLHSLSSLVHVRSWQLIEGLLFDLAFVGEQKICVCGEGGYRALVSLSGEVAQLAKGVGTAQIQALDVAKNGSFLATVDDGGSLCVVDLQSRKAYSQKISARALSGVVIGDDNRSMIITSSATRVWRCTWARQEELTVQEITPDDHGGVASLRLIKEHNGDKALVIRNNGIEIFDISSGKRTYRNDAVVDSMPLWFQGSHALAAQRHGSSFRHVRLPDIPVGQGRGLGHRAKLTSICRFDGGRRIATASLDGTVRIWRGQFPGATWQLAERGRSAIRGLTFDQSGERIAGISSKGDLLIWNAKTGQNLRRHQIDQIRCTTLKREPGGKRLVGAGTGGWFVTGFDEEKLQIRRQPARPLAVHWPVGSGDQLVLTLPGRIEMVSARSGKTLQRIELKQSGASAVSAVSPDGQFLVFELRPGRIVECPLTGSDVGKLTRVGEFSKPASGLVYLPGTPRRIAGCSYERSVILWTWEGDAFKQRNIGRLNSACGSLTLHPTEPRLVVGDLAERLHVWDTETWEHIFSSYDGFGGVLALAFAPDGERLAVGTMRRAVLLLHTNATIR